MTALDQPDVALDAPAVAGGGTGTDVWSVEAEQRAHWWENPDVRGLVELVTSVAVVVGAAVYVLAQLQPSLVTELNTPTGGDFGAHVWGPAFLRDHILPDWRLAGWAPDWYAGFPIYRFYMVLPALLVVALDVVLPYGVALKVVSVAGLMALPVACWAFGKLAGFEFPIPPLLAIAGVFFVFDETFTIYGGNAASTMAGEFSFSLALPLGMLYLGMFAYGLRTGRRRATTAVLFALAALCHLIVAIYLVVASILMFGLYANRKTLRYVLTTAPVAFLLSAFWLVPFYLSGSYTTDMHYDRRPYGDAPNGEPDSYWQMLFPHGQWIDLTMFVLANIAIVSSALKGRRMGVALGIWAYAFAGWALVWPTSFLWNARLLPFLYLCRFLLVAIGIWDVVGFVHRHVGLLARERAEKAATVSEAEALGARAEHINHPGARWLAGLATVVACSLVALFVLGMRFGTLPGGESTASGYSWLGLVENKKSQFVDDWARWNYSGYEGKAAYGEYHDLVNTMRDLGDDPQHGCGRALWEHNSGSYGTPMALMLLPFWTDGCIGSMEGLYFEASATTPYHFLAAAALSKQASNPVRRLEYTNNDVALGVRHLQDLGVRYYLAYNPEVVEQADANPDLTAVRQSGPWTVYEVADAPLVAGMTTEPIVVNDRQVGLELGLGGGERDRWLELGTSWFQHPDDWVGLPTADGPEDWQRVDAAPVANTRTTKDTLARIAPVEQVEARSLPPVQVSDVQTTTDSISFTVDQVGVPVLVRMSYYPNWDVSGAEGPYRVAPNFMVVVPTENEVTLSYGTTTMEWISYLLTLLGIVLAVVLWRRGPIDMDEPSPATVAVGQDGVAGGAATAGAAATWSPPVPPAAQPATADASSNGDDPTPPTGLQRPAIEPAGEPGTGTVGEHPDPSHVDAPEPPGEPEPAFEVLQSPATESEPAPDAATSEPMNAAEQELAVEPEAAAAEPEPAAAGTEPDAAQPGDDLAAGEDPDDTQPEDRPGGRADGDDAPPSPSTGPSLG
jgi:hypothetical protein